MHKTFAVQSIGLLLASLLPAAALHGADLKVINGNFRDLSGLTPLAGNAWYQGCPAGWKTSAKNPLYAVNLGTDGKHPACNVSQLGALEQDLGKLTQTADVVLTMDVADDWHRGADLQVELLDGQRETLGAIQLTAGSAQRLVVAKVPADTAVGVRFRALNGTTPGLRNVAIATHAPGSQTATPYVEIKPFSAGPAAGPRFACLRQFRPNCRPRQRQMSSCLPRSPCRLESAWSNRMSPIQYALMPGRATRV